MNKTVLFFGPYPKPITGQSISFKETYDKFNFKKILFDTSRFGSNKILNSLDSFIRLPYYFLFKKIDIIYFTCSRTFLGSLKDIFLLFFSFLKKMKVVCHLHGADFSDFARKNFITRLIIENLYSKIDRFIVLTEDMKEQFYFIDKKKIDVVENSFPSEFENYRVDLNLKKNQILFLSNIIASKGIFIFLDIVDELLKNNPKITVKIAGKFMADEELSTNDTRKKFYKKFDCLKKKYTSRIFYLGVIYGNDKISLLEESDVFVLPTFYKTEAFPISIIEAMRFGNAIVTTDHNYLSNIISDLNGFLIKKNNSRALYDSLQKLIVDKSKLCEIQNYNISLSKIKYSPSTYNLKIKNIITNL